MSWAGDLPFYLLIGTPQGLNRIDLDTPWLTDFAHLLREPGMWALMNKEDDRPIFMVVIHEGDQPYFTMRHVGIVGSAGSNEVVAYGIGKKQADGSVVRLWLMPDGSICGGEDIGDIGIQMVKALGPRQA